MFDNIGTTVQGCRNRRLVIPKHKTKNGVGMTVLYHMGVQTSRKKKHNKVHGVKAYQILFRKFPYIWSKFYLIWKWRAPTRTDTGSYLVGFHAVVTVYLCVTKLLITTFIFSNLSKFRLRHYVQLIYKFFVQLDVMCSFFSSTTHAYSSYITTTVTATSCDSIYPSFHIKFSVGSSTHFDGTVRSSNSIYLPNLVVTSPNHFVNGKVYLEVEINKKSDTYVLKVSIEILIRSDSYANYRESKLSIILKWLSYTIKVESLRCFIVSTHRFYFVQTLRPCSLQLDWNFEKLFSLAVMNY